MASPRETNLAVKRGLDALIGDPNKGTSKAHIFAAPIETADDLLGRGLIDDAGTATPEGVLFTQLKKLGMFDEGGALTPKGQAYSLSYEKVVSGGDDTLDAYRMRMEDGIDKPPVPMSDSIGVVKDLAWDFVTGVGERAGYSLQLAFNYNDDKRAAELNTKIDTLDSAIIDGALKANFDLAGMMGVANAHVLGLAWDMAGADEVSQTRIWRAYQNRDKIFFDNQAAKIGETLEDFSWVTGEVERQAQNKEILGKQEFDRLGKKGGAIGEFSDITVAVPGVAAFKAGSTVSKFTRLGVKADNILARGAIAEARIAEAALEQAALSRSATTAGTAAKTAQRMADDFAARFEATGDQILGQRAKMAGEIATRNSTLAARSTAELAEVSANLEKLTAQRAMLGTRLAEGAAETVQKSIQLGRQSKALPFTAVAGVAETLGKAITRVDDGLRSVVSKFGADKAYGAVRAGIGFAGFTVGGIPGAAVASTVLSSGKMLRSVGNFSRVVGKEMMKARGQIPFWQRVANRADISPVHRGLAHLMDTATLGGAVPGAVRRTARGVMAAYPLDLAFEFLADAGDINANTFKQAFAESLVIGGSSAAAGGAFLGSKERHRQLAIGDEMNFRADLADPVQKALFASIPNASRRAISTYAASNPQLNFNFTVQGSSFLSGNTATINLASKNPLKGLIGHEVMHHVVIRNQMEDGVIALLIGDGEAGGLLRSNDGTLDANFKQFWDEYQNRMGGPVDINTAALEYYVDSAADHFSNMAESGELGALSGRTEARRMMGAFIDATLPRIPLARDLHMKMGGLQDMSGKMVMGSGLLSDGIRELPAAKALTKAMLGRSAGRSQGTFVPLGQGGRADGGVVIPVQKGDKAVLAKLISIFETEEVNGQTRVKYDANGDPVMLNAGTDAARAKISVVLGEAMQSLRGQGKVPKPGELFINDQGGWEGNYLGEDVIRFLESRGILNKEQVRILKNLNAASRNFSGARFTVINHPATKKVGKKVRYATLAPTLRDVVPVAVIPTKDGNLLVGLMSVTQLMQNIQTRGESKRGKKLYQGNKEQMLNDVSAVMEMHRQNQRTDAYFDEKYGADKGAEYKHFINTLFGLMSPSMRDVNPLFEADKVGYKDNVYKTYRVDRISQATKMTGDTHIPMPFNYDRAKLNLMPNGLPTLDQNGDPVVRNMPEQARMMPEDVPYLKAVEVGDMDTVQRMVNEAARIAMPESKVRPNAAPESWNPYQHDANLPLIKLHHGGEKGITEFSKVIDRPQSGYKQGNLNSQGVWLTRSRGVEGELSEFFSSNDAATYAANYPEGGQIYDVYVNITNPKQMSHRDTQTITAKELLDQGFDGAYTIDSGFWIALKPEQIKSADPVTFDSNGQVIPLSQRFDSTSPAIRNMPEPVKNRNDAERLYAEGKEMFGASEMDGNLVPITSREMLNAYPPDALFWQEPNSRRNLPEPVIPKDFKQRPTKWKTLKDAPTITMHDLVGKQVFPTLADLTSAGEIYYGIDSSDVVVPIETSGGPGWPLLQSDTAWANTGKGVLSQKQKRAGMVMLVSAMMPDSHKSNSTSTKAIIETNLAYARDGKITKSGINEINKLIRNEVGKDFPGIKSSDALPFIEKESFATRTRVAEIFESKFAQGHGAANVKRILNALIDKDHAGANWGDALLAIELDPDGAFVKFDESDVHKHPAYEYGVKGKVLGKLARPINRMLIYDDFIAKRKSDGKDPENKRAFDFSRPVQLITEEIANRVPQTAYQHLKSPKHALLLDHAVNDRWVTTGGTVKEGGLSPAEVVDAINASPARLALDRYTPKELGDKVKSGEMSLYKLEDSEVMFGIKNGDPASGYGKDPHDYGFGPNEKTLSLVINNEISASGMADVIVNKALQEGVTALDAFSVKTQKFPGGMLPTIYERFNFSTVGEIPFDPSYYTKTELRDLKHYWQSLGWTEKDGLPTIIMMRWGGEEADRVNPLRQVAAEGQEGLQAGDSSGGLLTNAREDLERVNRGRSGEAQGGREQGDGDGVGGSKGTDAGPLRVSSSNAAAISELLGLSPIERQNLGLRPASSSPSGVTGDMIESASKLKP
jgi:hypothetical protein